MSKSPPPFAVGDVVVFNSEYVDSIPGMQDIGSLIGEVTFDDDAVMVIQSITPYSGGQSGWNVTTALQDKKDAGEMVEWDSAWFVRKEEVHV